MKKRVYKYKIFIWAMCAVVLLVSVMEGNLQAKAIEPTIEVHTHTDTSGLMTDETRFMAMVSSTSSASVASTFFMKDR